MGFSSCNGFVDKIGYRGAFASTHAAVPWLWVERVLQIPAVAGWDPSAFLLVQCVM